MDLAVSLLPLDRSGVHAASVSTVVANMSRIKESENALGNTRAHERSKGLLVLLHGGQRSGLGRGGADVGCCAVTVANTALIGGALVGAAGVLRVLLQWWRLLESGDLARWLFLDWGGHRDFACGDDGGGLGDDDGSGRGFDDDGGSGGRWVEESACRGVSKKHTGKSRMALTAAHEQSAESGANGAADFTEEGQEAGELEILLQVGGADTVEHGLELEGDGLDGNAGLDEEVADVGLELLDGDCDWCHFGGWVRG